MACVPHAHLQWFLELSEASYSDPPAVGPCLLCQPPFVPVPCILLPSILCSLHVPDTCQLCSLSLEYPSLIQGSVPVLACYKAGLHSFPFPPLGCESGGRRGVAACSGFATASSPDPILLWVTLALTHSLCDRM